MAAQKTDISKIKNAPVPKPQPTVTRLAIRNLQDTKPNLIAAINGQDLPDGLKNYLVTTIEALPTNAARLDVHVIERPDGGENGHWSIKGINLGSASNTFFKRATQPPVTAPAAAVTVS